MESEIHILYLEDEKVLAQKTKLILEYENYTVTHVQNGIEGLEKAREFTPDLVICDIGMPLMDGYEFYEAFKKLGKKEVPFIFLSAFSQQADIRKGMNIGADDYLTKPIVRTELLDAINTRLAKRNDINNVIEELTKKYSNEIAARDNCLKDIAQNQSHVIRAPLATLMAVVNLIDIDKIDGDNKILVNMLAPLTEKLDAVIRENVYQINQITD